MEREEDFNLDISEIDDSKKEGHEIIIVYDEEQTPNPELEPVERKVGISGKEAENAYELPNFLKQVALYNTGKFVFTSDRDDAIISDFREIIDKVENKKNSYLHKYTRGPHVIYFIPNSVFFEFEKKLQDEDGHINYNDRETLYLMHKNLIFDLYNKYKPFKNRQNLNDYTGEEILAACELGFTKALNTFSSKKNSKFTTYAYTIMERECINVIRHFVTQKKTTSDGDKIFVETMDDEEADVTYIGVEGDLELAELKIQINDMLKELPKESEFVLRSYFGIGTYKMTQLEIADMLHCSQSLIHIKIKDALKALNKKIVETPSSLLSEGGD